MTESDEGERHPLEQLIERNLPSLKAFLGTRVGPVLRGQESTADLVQSVCREVLQDQDVFEFQGEAAFRAWLFEVARRKMVDRHRYYTRAKRDVQRTFRSKESKDPLQAPNTATPSEEASFREQAQSLWSALDELDAGDRQVIVLFHIFGLSHQEMAEQLGRSPSASRSQLSRALARLSRVLRRTS